MCGSGPLGHRTGGSFSRSGCLGRQRGPAGTFLASGAKGGRLPQARGEEVLMADGWNPEGGASVQGAGAVSDWPLGREAEISGTEESRQQAQEAG